MPYEPIIPKGQRLGKSHSVDGAVTGHLFDGDNGLKGHASWRWVDEPEEPYLSDPYEDEEPPRALTPEEIEALLLFVGAVVIGIVKAVEVATPVVKRIWVGKVVPAFKSGVERVKRVRRSMSRRTARPEPSVFVASTSGVIDAVTQSQIRMSRAEWEQRLRAMLASEAFVNEQARLLSTTLIAEPAGGIEASKASEPLEPRQFAAQITRALEVHPELLTRAAMSEVLRVVEPRQSPG